MFSKSHWFCFRIVSVEKYVCKTILLNEIKLRSITTLLARMGATSFFVFFGRQKRYSGQPDWLLKDSIIKKGSCIENYFK